MESVQPSQDAVQADGTTDKLEESVPSTEQSVMIPRKRLVEAESSAQDGELPNDSIDTYRPTKRPRMSGCEDDSVRAETTPPPLALEVQETPQKDNSAARTPEIEESPKPRGHQSSPARGHDSAPIADNSKNDRFIRSSAMPGYIRSPTPQPATEAINDKQRNMYMVAIQSEPSHDGAADGVVAHDTSAADEYRGLAITTAVDLSHTASEGTSLNYESVGNTADSPSSELTSLPSSPTLDAQAQSIEIEPLMDNEKTAQPPVAVQKTTETVEEANVVSIQPANPGASYDGTNAEQADVSMQDAQSTQDATTLAPDPQVPASPTQLPTPPSSAASQTSTAELVKLSGRARKKPDRFGAGDQSFATSEEVGPNGIPEDDDVDFQLSVSKKSKASTSAKADTAPLSRTKSASSASKKILAKSRARVTKSGSNRITLTTPSTRKAAASTATPKGRNLNGSQDKTSKKTPGTPRTPTAPKVSRKKNKLDVPSISILALTAAQEITVDARKLGISKLMSWREPVDLKPAPAGQPRVWAESRQALCETLPYFKKPQGGCYSNDGHVYGFLFDGVGHCREYLDESLILCRAGGSMEADSASGGMAQKKDQSMTEAQVQSIINDMKHHNPVIVICGSKNVAAPTKMPHQYNVLGWYKPVYVWAEKTQGKGSKVYTTIKYRLERLNQHLEPAWYSPENEQSPISEEDKAYAGQLFSKQCDYCGTNSPQIYLQGWWCVNPGCDAFWEINNSPAPCGKGGLDYDPAFLLHRYPLWKNDDQEREPVPADVRPSVPRVGDLIGDNLYYINTRGVCCPKCGRCNSRRKFSGWKCENPGCNWSLTPEHKPVLPTMLHTPWDAAPTLVRNRHADGVHVESMHLHGYKISRYTFNGVNGCFLHLAATKEVLEEKNGPNEMFATLQSADMGLERRVFAVSKMSGGKPKEGLPEPSTQEDGVLVEENANEATGEFAAGDLMMAFSMNYGMPYKFVASGGSQAFDTAPSPVTECRRRLNWAQKTFLSNQDEYMDFNEELLFAYLEGQKIEYHDDGESGLGPRIATLSLGGRAKMHMRIKSKHFVGCSKVGVFTEERPVPGGIDGAEMDRKRMEKWEELQTLKRDSVAYNKRRKEISKELGIFEKKMKKANDLVTVTLSHGDMIIMDGRDIQKYLEHKVVPEGYLRFALTCRTVLPDHLKSEERPVYKVEEDPITYNGPELATPEGQ